MPSEWREGGPSPCATPVWVVSGVGTPLGAATVRVRRVENETVEKIGELYLKERGKECHEQAQASMLKIAVIKGSPKEEKGTGERDMGFAVGGSGAERPVCDRGACHADFFGCTAMSRTGKSKHLTAFGPRSQRELRQLCVHLYCRMQIRTCWVLFRTAAGWSWESEWL